MIFGIMLYKHHLRQYAREYLVTVDMQREKKMGLQQGE